VKLKKMKENKLLQEKMRPRELPGGGVQDPGPGTFRSGYRQNVENL
jgi:hypothetical protein